MSIQFQNERWVDGMVLNEVRGAASVLGRLGDAPHRINEGDERERR